MPILYQKWILRTDLQANPGQSYVFGDNTQRRGLGGQAKYMRGEPNAIGVATKWAPDNNERSFFMDQVRCIEIVMGDLARVRDALKAGRTVVIPEDGIGTGLSQLPERAPGIDEMIKTFWKEMERDYGLAVA